MTACPIWDRECDGHDILGYPKESFKSLSCSREIQCLVYFGTAASVYLVYRAFAFMKSMFDNEEKLDLVCIYVGIRGLTRQSCPVIDY